MEIESFQRIGKSENFRVFLNSGFKTILSSETIIKNNLKVGTQISEEQLKQIHIENEKNIAFDKAIKLISKVSKTEKETREYLSQKGYLQEVVDFAVEKMKEYHYLDDYVYACDFVSCHKQTQGRKMLSFKLQQKGVKKEYIEKALESFSEKESAFSVAEKYMKNKPFDFKGKQKCYAYLLSKGYGYETINNVVSKLFSGSDDDWDWYFRS